MPQHEWSRPSRLSGLASSPGRAAACLVAIGLVAVTIRIVFAVNYHGPWVFDDELGYQQLAQSLGTTGKMALFGKQGLSYSPLYPALLAPLYWLDPSGPAAYHWAKIVNCVVITIPIWPVYRIARFVLPRGRSLVAAGLSAAMPLMLYSALEMSESLAYTLALFAFWAMVIGLRSPGFGRDALVIVLCVVAAAARLQLAALIPAAFVAVVLDALLLNGRSWTVVRRSLRAHALLTVATVGLALVVAAGIAGTKVLALAGRYANQHNIPSPPPWLMTKLVVQHFVGLEFAAGIVPAAGTILAAYLFARSPRRSPSRRPVAAFASMAVSVTVFLTLLAAYATYGQEYVPGESELPRIHERYFMYVLPLFLIAMLATSLLPRSDRLRRQALLAGLAVVVLTVAIPYHTVLTNGVATDSFGLSPLVTAAPKGGVQALPHATLFALLYAACLVVIYALARPNLALLTAVVATVFVGVSLQTVRLLNAGAKTAIAHTLPGRPDWVDAAGARRGVVVLELPHEYVRRDLAVGETAFYNRTISKLVYACDPLFSPDFGEIPITFDRTGVVRGPGGVVKADYLVAPIGLGVAGRVVARDVPGKLELLRPPGGVVRITPGLRALWRCPKRTR